MGSHFIFSKPFFPGKKNLELLGVLSSVGIWQLCENSLLLWDHCLLTWPRGFYSPYRESMQLLTARFSDNRDLSIYGESTFCVGLVFELVGFVGSEGLFSLRFLTLKPLWFEDRLVHRSTFLISRKISLLYMQRNPTTGWAKSVQICSINRKSLILKIIMRPFTVQKKLIGEKKDEKQSVVTNNKHTHTHKGTARV